MAAKYMRLYRNRERVPDLQATSIREAVALLAEPRENESPAEPEDVQTSAPAEGAPEIEPVLEDTKDESQGYRNDPEIERANDENRSIIERVRRRGRSRGSGESSDTS